VADRYGDEPQPLATSALEPEPFPAAAELVLAQHILTRGLRDGGNGRRLGKSGEPGPYVWTGP
jgi:hypothetical protein